MASSLNLTVTSPVQSFTEVFTLAEIEHFLGLPALSPVDEERNALLNAFIAGAREQAEIAQGRDLVEKQYDLTMEAFAEEIELRDPLVSVDLVKYRDSDGTYHTLTEGTDYIVDTAKHPGIIRPVYGGSWPSFTPWPSSPVLVRFTSGLASTDPFWSGAGGKSVMIGMKMLISAWFGKRIPFELGASAVQTYPFTVSLLEAGSLPRVR